MPEIIFKADQGAGVRKIIRIMQGDTRSHVIRFVVPRYDSGVDLAPLVWYIKFVDAEGTPDIALPSAMYEVAADDIRVRWTVNGISTDTVGSTKFQLYGVGKDADGNKISWTSGAGEIEVTENIGFEVSDEDEEKLTALDELIVFVQGELNGVITAGNNAAAAAATANAAAERAEAAADGAVDATAAAIRANAAAEAAESAAANANAVMDVKANALAASVTGNPAQFWPDEGSVLKPVLTFEPVQEGSGDPYPTGGGKNLLPNNATTQTVNGVTFTVNADGSVTVSGTATATALFLVGKVALKAGTTYACGSGTADIGFSLRTGNGATVVHDFAASITYTPAEDAELEVCIRVGSGKTVNATVYPQVEAGSTATSYAPHSNIRPITGRTGAELVRCGKNLLKYPYYTTATALNGITFEHLGDGRVHIKGTATAYVVFHLQNYTAGNRAELKPGTYAISGNPSNDFPISFYFFESMTTDKEGAAYRISGGNSNTFTLDKTMYYGAYAWINSGTTVDVVIAPQLELGSTASAFAPYQGDTFTLDFGQTVYGGTLDWNEGLLTTPDNRARAFDGTEGWNKASAANTFYLDYYNSGGSAGSPYLMDAVSSHYKTSASVTLGSNDMAYYPLSYTDAIYRHVFTDSRFSTVAEWKAYLAEQAAAGTPVQAIEKLPTPATFQLTPQQITALAGGNTVYSDADGMTVNYNRDLANAYEELKNAIIAMGGNV